MLNANLLRAKAHRACESLALLTVALTPDKLFCQRLYGDFFEEDDVCVFVGVFALLFVIVAVVLQANPADVRPRTPRALEPELPRRNRIAFGVVGDLDAIEHDDGARAVKGDLHRVPFGAGLAGLGQRLGERIEAASDVVLVFARGFGMVVDLPLETIVDGHPGLAGLEGNA